MRHVNGLGKLLLLSIALLACSSIALAESYLPGTAAKNVVGTWKLVTLIADSAQVIIPDSLNLELKISKTGQAHFIGGIDGRIITVNFTPPDSIRFKNLGGAIQARLAYLQNGGDFYRTYRGALTMVNRFVFEDGYLIFRCRNGDELQYERISFDWQ